MQISGKKIQLELLPKLKERIARLKEQGVEPGLGIITLGPEETWEAYVGQKIKLANELQIHHELLNLSPKTTDDVLKAIDTLNSKNTIHGLIVQRPFPTHIDTERVIQSVSNSKDIDGFRKDTIFEVPVWLAVRHLLTYSSGLLSASEFKIWLSNQSILVVGKGETAGMPVINALKKLEIPTFVMDSKTENPEELLMKASVIIFATGKRIEVPFKKLKKHTILIGIGLHRDEDGLQGDFDQNEAEKNGLYYTPSPGGVGPLNLYYLFDNLITACENS